LPFAIQNKMLTSIGLTARNVLRFYKVEKARNTRAKYIVLRLQISYSVTVPKLRKLLDSYNKVIAIITSLGPELEPGQKN